MMLIAATFVVVVSAPPLSPEDAVRVLRGSRSVADRTDMRSYPEPVESRVIVIRSTPPPRLGLLPVYNPPITFRLHRKGGHR